MTSGIFEETLIDDVVVPSFRVRIPNVGSMSLISKSRTATLSEDGTTLARGRVVGLPTDLGGDEVEVEFLCVPDGEEAVMKAAADLMRVGEINMETATGAQREAAEIYDPQFFPRDDDSPTSVLAGTTDYWRWHPTTNALELIPIVPTGGTTLPEDDGFGEIRITPLDPPRSASKMKLTASWTQESKGQQVWPIALGTWEIQTYSFDDLVAALPVVGTPIGQNTGWYIAESEIKYINELFSPDIYDVDPTPYIRGEEEITTCEIWLRKKAITFGIRLGWEYQQQREDVLLIEMPGSTQSVLGDDRQEPMEEINLSGLNIDHETPPWEYVDPDTHNQRSYSAGDLVQANGQVWRCVAPHEATEMFRAWRWIGYPNREQLWVQAQKKSAISDSTTSARFWDTPRGERARNHAIRRLRRQVLERAYCLEVEFDCTWNFAKSVTTKSNVTVNNNKMISGSITGRVVSKMLIAEGSERRGRIRLHVPVGKGGGGSGGDFSTGGVSYSLHAPNPRQPVNLAALKSVSPRVTVENDYAAQRAAAIWSSDPVAMIQSMPTRAVIDVDPIQEEDLIVRYCKVVCNPVSIPSGVSL